jgi:hypothetical protein
LNRDNLEDFHTHLENFFDVGTEDIHDFVLLYVAPRFELLDFLGFHFVQRLQDSVGVGDHKVVVQWLRELEEFLLQLKPVFPTNGEARDRIMRLEIKIDSYFIAHLIATYNSSIAKLQTVLVFVV